MAATSDNFVRGSGQLLFEGNARDSGKPEDLRGQTAVKEGRGVMPEPKCARPASDEAPCLRAGKSSGDSSFPLVFAFLNEISN